MEDTLRDSCRYSPCAVQLRRPWDHATAVLRKLLEICQGDASLGYLLQQWVTTLPLLSYISHWNKIAWQKHLREEGLVWLLV